MAGVKARFRVVAMDMCNLQLGLGVGLGFRERIRVRAWVSAKASVKYWFKVCTMYMFVPTVKVKATARVWN